MTTWLDHLIQSVPPLLAYVVVALVVGIESLGIPLPGEAVMVSAALLAAHAHSPISPHFVAIGVVVGAVTGDSIGYYIGHRFGDRVFTFLGRRFPKHFNPDSIAYAEHVFKRYGVAAVFVGRFIPLLRMFAGPLSGMLKMHYRRFLAANVAGAIVWGTGTTYAVYYLGRAAETYLQRFSYIGLGVGICIAVLSSVFLRKKLERNVAAFAEQRRAQQQSA